MTVIWAWLVGLITETLKKFQGLAQIAAFLNKPKGCKKQNRNSKSLPCSNRYFPVRGPIETGPSCI